MPTPRDEITPRRHRTLREVLDATYDRPACPGSKNDWPDRFDTSSYETEKNRRDFDEDCLYINVYVPRNISEVEHVNILSLPVMVFIHGGPFPADGGWLLAQYGDVLVVTVQYRLGVLGFLSSGDDLAQGNLALLDQRTAMHWIWDNIRELGGNSDRITVFGEGRGAISIGYHVISPLSRGLFTRAISQSGTMLTRCCRQPNPAEMLARLTEEMGCRSGNASGELACLRSVGLNNLLSSAEKVAEQFKDSGWFPVIDGNVIPGDPYELLQAGKYNEVDYIIGINSHEGWMLQRLNSLDLKQGISQVDFEQFMHSTTSRYYEVTEQRLTALYLEYAYCKNTQSERTRAMVEFFGDLKYNAPAEMTARILSRGNRNIYFYQFSHQPSYKTRGLDVDSNVQAVNGDEFDFMFGHALYTIKDATDSERALAEAMMKAWTNFAKTGNPNPVNQMGTNWRQFKEGRRYYMELSARLNSKSTKLALRQGKMAFWNDYFPALSSRDSCPAEDDLCYRRTASVRDVQERTSTVMWVLIGVCTGLLLLVIILLFKLFCAKDFCVRSDPRKERTRIEGEDRKLRPLPYCDET